MVLHDFSLLQQGQARGAEFLLPYILLLTVMRIPPLNTSMSVKTSSEIYITTPLYYVNAQPHLGHAYATTLADVLAVFHRQNAKKTVFLTGTDEHGEKIEQKAKSVEKSPQVFVDEVALQFQNCWKTLGLSPDIFYRTTATNHKKVVQEALLQLKSRGEIYFGTYEGRYCVGCERFRTDQEWTPEGLCPDHLKPGEQRSESNYFFRMSAYQERLIAHYKKNPDAIQPASYMNEVLKFLEAPLEDLSISRPVERLKWGIPLPFDPQYVTYVWFDALLNYPTALGYNGKPSTENPEFQKSLWEQAHHFIGKDILKTHAIYWPTMLMGLGLPMFNKLLVTGHWLVDGHKMSKSLGNVIEPEELATRYGLDSFRYFFLREASFGSDANFTWNQFVTRCNADLANGLGNLASRVLTLVSKNLENRVPSGQQRNEADEALIKQIRALPERFQQSFNEFKFHIALAEFSEAVALCDRYINEQKPWALAKEQNKDRLSAVLGTAMDALWCLSVVGASTLPIGTKSLRAALGRPSADAPHFREALRPLSPGSPLGEVPRLYPRLELPA